MRLLLNKIKVSLKTNLLFIIEYGDKKFMG
jgi:hypothetical protein